MPTITANGVDLYVERQGEGRPLFLFNGSGSTIESMRLLIDVLAGSFDVLVHDQRGLGRSAVPEPPYTMSDYAADAAALLDEVGWSSCRIMGVSFGGMVALEFAASWPQRVERLALCCTSPGGRLGSSYPLHELADLPAAERAAIALQLLDTRFDQEWLDSHPSDRALVDRLAEGLAGTRTAEQQKGEAAQLGARSTHDVCDRLGQITCPTLVAAGRYDGIAPLPNAEAIVGRVPDATLSVYEGGHAFLAQDPAAVADVMAFLAADAG